MDEGMSELHPLLALLTEQLPHIDKYLARGGIELEQRPLMAAIEFATFCIVEVRDGNGKRSRPELPNLLSERWFAFLFRDVENWYRKRYGVALERSFKKTATGFAVLWETAFEMQVPLARRRPGKPGETIWLSFPDSIHEGEDPFTWLTAPPVLTALSPLESRELDSSIREIAGLLRSINTALLGVGRIGPRTNGLLRQAWSHLERAAQNVVDDSNPKTSIACWDLQMACECALKAVLDKAIGHFPKIHPLDKLYARTRQHIPGLRREWIDQLPSSSEAIELRYGKPGPSLREYSRIYLAGLRIVDKAFLAVATFQLGKAEFEIARAPWISAD